LQIHFNLCLGLPSSLFPPPPLFSVHATCPAHLIFLI
jgi:hypothetical protein